MEVKEIAVVSNLASNSEYHALFQVTSDVFTAFQKHL